MLLPGTTVYTLHFTLIEPGNKVIGRPVSLESHALCKLDYNNYYTSGTTLGIRTVHKKGDYTRMIVNVA